MGGGATTGGLRPARLLQRARRPLSQFATGKMPVVPVGSVGRQRGEMPVVPVCATGKTDGGSVFTPLCVALSLNCLAVVVCALPRFGVEQKPKDLR